MGQNAEGECREGIILHRTALGTAAQDAFASGGTTKGATESDSGVVHPS